MGTALYIGRFQPFHKGHMDVVKFIGDEIDVDRIIIAVGSSQYNDRNRNPYTKRAKNVFTFDERKEMIEKSLHGVISKCLEIHPIPDFHDYDKWYTHVIKDLPSFDFYYTTAKKEREYFLSKGHDVREFPVLYDFHATTIRNRIFNGEEYRSQLPKGTLGVFDRVKGADRVREAYTLDITEEMRK